MTRTPFAIMLASLSVIILFHNIQISYAIDYEKNVKPANEQQAAENNPAPDTTPVKVSKPSPATVQSPSSQNQVSAQQVAQDSKKVTLIIVSKSQNKLRLYGDQQIIATFPVATGKNKCTPVGSYVIINKVANPGKACLGSRWMGLNKVGRSGRRYGIHGTNHPDSIGKWRSAGCIRLHNENAIKIFEITPVNTPVIISNQNLPETLPVK